MSSLKQPAVYILASKRNGTLYPGVTSDLVKRVWQHKNNVNPGSFTSKYNLHKLVYFETFESIEEAIEREKQLKRWHREWKLNLIKSVNPTFRDLYDEIKDDFT